MAEITYEQAAKGLAARDDLAPGELAAVRLLLWHETWLRRDDFRKTCVIANGPMFVYWWDARTFYDSKPHGASSSQMKVLALALALAEDEFGFGGFGYAHKRAVAEAFATALGQELTPAKPVHSHPEFIPCDEVLKCPARQPKEQFDA